jgi:hypothetical protein
MLAAMRRPCRRSLTLLLAVQGGCPA